MEWGFCNVYHIPLPKKKRLNSLVYIADKWNILKKYVRALHPVKRSDVTR